MQNLSVKFTVSVKNLGEINHAFVQAYLQILQKFSVNFNKICISPKIQFRLHRPIGLPPYPNRQPIGYHAAASLQASVITCGSAWQATNPVRPEISFIELPFVLNRKSTKHKFQVL